MTARLRPYEKTMVALFFVALIIIGLVTAMDYGRPWDEPGEIGILRMALKEYTLHIPVETQYSKALQTLGTIPISESVEKDHGISGYYPVFWAVCQTNWSLQQTAMVWRMHTWMLFILGAFSLYAIGRHMGFSRVVSCIAVLLLVLSPRFFAEGHYNNKDVALLSFTLLVLWQTMRMVQKPTFVRAVWFALAAALCTNTRIIGAAVCGLCGVMIVIRLALAKQLTPRIWLIGAVTVGLSVLFYALLTPAMLSDPFGFALYLVKNAVGFSRWHGTILYNGALIESAWEKPPMQYLPVMIALTTPIWGLVLLCIGQVWAVARMIKSKTKMFLDNDCFMLVIASLLWLVPLLGGMATRMLVYNGWRHLYFIYGPMLIVMTFAIDRLWALAQQRKVARVVAASALVVVLGAEAVGIAANHPYQYGYYNALVPRTKLESRFELDYWNLSCVSALQQLLDKADPGEVIRVMPSDRRTRSGLILAVQYMDTKRIEVVENMGDMPESVYLIANQMYATINHAEPGAQWEPIIVTQSYGVSMTVIYAPTTDN